MIADDWQAYGSLFLAAGFIPLAFTFYALVFAGYRLTEPDERSRLGNWLAVFCAANGTVYVCMTVLMVNRWIDLDPATSNPTIGIVFRVIGIVALFVALLAAHYAGPAVMKRIWRSIRHADP